MVLDESKLCGLGIDILVKQAGGQNDFMKLGTGWNASVAWGENTGLGVLHDGGFCQRSKAVQSEA